MMHLLIRSLSMAAIGVLILMFREEAMPFIVMCVGALFVLPSLFALIASFLPFFRQKAGGAVFPAVTVIIAGGSLALGLWMMLNPAFFVAILMTLLGVVMIVAGVGQLFSLLSARRAVNLSAMMYIVPLMLMLAGAVVLFNPFGVASLPFFIIGVGTIVAAFSDIINTLYIYLRKRAVTKNSDAEVIEVTSDGDNSVEQSNTK